MSKKLFLLGIALMMVMVGTSAPAVAGQAHLEVYGGYYVPGQSELDDDLVFGLRFIQYRVGPQRARDVADRTAERQKCGFG